MVDDHFDVGGGRRGARRQRRRAGPRAGWRPGGARRQGRLPPGQSVRRPHRAPGRATARRSRTLIRARRHPRWATWWSSARRDGGCGCRASPVAPTRTTPSPSPVGLRRMLARRCDRRRRCDVGQAVDAGRERGTDGFALADGIRSARRHDRRRRRRHEPGRRGSRTGRPRSGAVGIRDPGLPRRARRSAPTSCVGTEPGRAFPDTAGSSPDPTGGPTSARRRHAGDRLAGAGAVRRAGVPRAPASSGSASTRRRVRHASAAGSRWASWARRPRPATSCSSATRPGS